jgi:hypothetical protein
MICPSLILNVFANVQGPLSPQLVTKTERAEPPPIIARLPNNVLSKGSLKVFIFISIIYKKKKKWGYCQIKVIIQKNYFFLFKRNLSSIKNNGINGIIVRYKQ